MERQKNILGVTTYAIIINMLCSVWSRRLYISEQQLMYL